MLHNVAFQTFKKKRQKTKQQQKTVENYKKEDIKFVACFFLDADTFRLQLIIQY